MAAASSPFELDITKLTEFHLTHFPSQPVPNISSASAQSKLEQNNHVARKWTGEHDDGLGYYEDGVKRTLTANQIQIFRHSEIQRLLAARRREAEVRDYERSRVEDRKEETKKTHLAQARVVDSSSMNKSEMNGVSGRTKRKAHFDESQDESAEVVLDY
jgi:hypothetical protein